MLPSLPVAMGWRHLLFRSYPVDPAVVRPRLPEGLAVDTHDGAAYLTVVPYTNVAVRPRGLPRAVGVRLPELNLRTYVDGPAGPGVYFHSLDADGLLGVGAARLTHGLPYYRATASVEAAGGRVRVRFTRRHPGARQARYAATYRPTGRTFRPEPGSRAAWLTERYRVYTEGPDGRLRVADVEHEPWTLYEAAVEERETTLFAAEGFERPSTEPVDLYARGTDVVTSRSRVVEP